MSLCYLVHNGRCSINITVALRQDSHRCFAGAVIIATITNDHKAWQPSQAILNFDTTPTSHSKDIFMTKSGAFE